MSWAKHDIEGWQAVEVAGVKMRMMKLPTQHKPTIETQDILEQLQDVDGPVWAALTEWAVKEIGLAEQNYLSSGSDPYYDEPPRSPGLH